MVKMNVSVSETSQLLSKAQQPFQLVYLSDNAARLRQSLTSFIEHYRADRVVVLCPERSAAEMRSLMDDLALEGVVLTDEQLIPGNSIPTDHSSRNFRLRRALYKTKELEPLFLSLDDDCVLLRKLPDDYFVCNGRIVARYSHNSLSNWKADGVHEPTSFDNSQWQTGELLTEQGYTDLGFSAHQAQLVEKKTVNEIYYSLAQFENFAGDEWSIYFNIALKIYPDLFVAKQTTTLFWPMRYAAWLPGWFEDEIWFENRYDEVYESGGIAQKSGIGPDTDWRHKVRFCKAGYATYHAQRLMNELSNGQIPMVDFGSEVTSSVNQLFGLPGIILKLNVDTNDGNEISAQYLITEGSKPVPETASLTQTVSNKRSLALKLPNEPGEYCLTIGGTKSSKIQPLSLPLFILPFPVGGNY